jgi:RecA/RadA recombinase
VLGVNLQELLISQPDNGEQALENRRFADPFRRSRSDRHRLPVAALTPAELEGEMATLARPASLD